MDRPATLPQNSDKSPPPHKAATVGRIPDTLRRHTFRVAESLPVPATAEPAGSAEAIVVTLDSTFVRSCEEGERHLEVRIGNVETTAGRRQVFGAVAKTDTDPAALIRRSLDAVGRPVCARRWPPCEAALICWSSEGVLPTV